MSEPLAYKEKVVHEGEKPNGDTPPEPTPAEDAEAKLQAALAEIDKWKSLSRKHEDQAKSNAKKAQAYDEYAESQKTEQQKLEDRLAAAEARAAKAEHEALLNAVARDKKVPVSALVGETREELEACADALIEWRGDVQKTATDFGAGQRGKPTSGKLPQLTKADLQRMYAERKYAEIDKARRNGQFDDLLTKGE